MAEYEDALWDEDDRRRRMRLLEAAGMAQAQDVPLDLAELAAKVGLNERSTRRDLGDLAEHGLALDGLEEGLPPILRTAGRQFLARGAVVRHDVLRFLPRTIEDLNTREALLVAGTVLVDEFRAAWLDGDPVDHAREMLPRAFAAAVDERVALDLFAAAVALMARLSDEPAAGCVAEEIIAVNLIEEARAWLEGRTDEGALGADEHQAACEDLRGLFELFEDDDVLDTFDMTEPADAAMAGHDPINRQLGVVDQRLEAWFDPFGWAAPTGYLRERSGSDE
jgi:hypothetical protein